MQFCTQWEIYCDSLETDPQPEGCHSSGPAAFTRKECIDAAKKDGWLIRNGVALCPYCRPIKQSRRKAGSK